MVARNSLLFMKVSICFCGVSMFLCALAFGQNNWRNPDGSPYDFKKIDRYMDVDTDWHEFYTGLPNAEPMDTTNTIITLTMIVGRELPDAIAVRVFPGNQFVEGAMTNWIPYQEKIKVDLGEGDGERNVYVVAKWNSKPGLTRTGSGFGVTVKGRGPRKKELSDEISHHPPVTHQIINLGKNGDVLAEANLGTNIITLNASTPACGSFKLHMNGLFGRGFILFSSTNLISWEPVLTNLNSSAAFDYTDTNMANYGCRFFQVRPLQ